MPLVVYYSNLSPTKIDTAIDWQLSFAREFRKHESDFKWLVFSSEFDDKFRALKDEGLSVEIIPRSHTSGFRLLLFLLRFLINHDVDVFYMNFIKPVSAVFIIILSRIMLRKTIFIYHKRSPGKLIFNKANIKKYVNPLSLISRFVKIIICNSDSIVYNCINRCVSGKKTVRIYNGIRIQRFAVRDTGKIRRELNIPEDYRIVSSIKDARPEVGLQDLIYSISEVLYVHSNVVFLIVGGGVDTSKLKGIVRRLGIENHVIFTGIRNDIPDIIAESYFTVDPSPVEAFGNVIVESMAGKKPVVAVNAWGPREIILPGETGILVEKGMPTNFAPAINELLSSAEKVKLMGEKSFTRVNQIFGLDEMINETVQLILKQLDWQLMTHR